MKPIWCSLLVASLASDESSAKHGTASDARRTTVSSMWRALLSTGTSAMEEFRRMVIDVEGLSNEV